MTDDQDGTIADLNRRFDQVWTTAFAGFHLVPLTLIAAIIICAAGAALLLAGVAAIYPPAALVLAGAGLLYLGYVISTHEGS